MAENPMRWVRAATLAPSGHNSQPWKFAVGEGVVRFFPDLSRALPVVDPAHRELYISLGCALENLLLAARSDGATPEVTLLPRGEPACAAVVAFAPGEEERSPLRDAIVHRQTNRRAYDGRPLDEPMIRALDAVPVEPGVYAQLILDHSMFSGFQAFVAEADRQQLNSSAYLRELLQWMRFNHREMEQKKDGLWSASVGFPNIPRWLGERAMQRKGFAETQAREDAALVETSSALLMISTERDDREAWLAAGRTLERLILTATSLGLQHAYLNQIVQVPDLRSQLIPRMVPGPNFAQLVLRLGRASALPHSPRRPLSDVLIEYAEPGRALPAEAPAGVEEQERV